MEEQNFSSQNGYNIIELNSERSLKTLRVLIYLVWSGDEASVMTHLKEHSQGAVK
jgi:hypothetical protein